MLTTKTTGGYFLLMCRQFMQFPGLLIFLPLKLRPVPLWLGGEGVNSFGQLMTFPGLLNCWPPKPPWDPPGMGWVKCFWPWMIPGSIRTCVPNLVAVRRSCRKKGWGYRHTHPHTPTHTPTHVRTQARTRTHACTHTHTQRDTATFYSIYEERLNECRLTTLYTHEHWGEVK